MSLRRPPTESEIAQRAWELYQQRGHGEAEAHRDLRDARVELEAAELAAEAQDADLHPEPEVDSGGGAVVIPLEPEER